MSLCRLLLVFGVAVVATPRLSRALVVNYPADPLPALVAAGDTLNVSALASFGSFVSCEPGGVINVLENGGVFSLHIRGVLNAAPLAAGVASLNLDGGLATIQGGAFGMTVDVKNGGKLHVDGANVLTPLRVNNGSAFFHSGSMFGGSIEEGGTLTIFGPGATGEIQVVNGELNIVGGGLTPHPQAPPSSTILSVFDQVNLFVRSALIGGTPVAGLQQGIPVTIASRNVTLDMVLADGTPYVMPLTTFVDGTPSAYAFRNSSVVTVTLLPEPSSGVATAIAIVLSAARGSRRRTVRGRR
jgi:hypothetical protein